VTEDSCLHILSTIARAFNHDEAGWAVASVALETAVVPTRELFQARSATRRSRLTTLNWRVKLGNVARAVEGDSGDIFARLAVA